MNATLDAFLRSWPFDPWLLVALTLSACIYCRGWLLLHRRAPSRWHWGQVGAFLGGLAALFLALASPVEPFALLLLQVHMLQHLLLMMVAPPLLWLGAPLFPLLRGLPQSLRTYWAAPLFRAPFLRRLCARLTHPLTALPLFVGATWFWHLPAVYDWALRSDALHYLQHACFLGTALVFWYAVVRPYPSRPGWSLWLLVPYLILADVQNTILSALLTFSDRVLYPYYTQVPRVGGVSVLEDQSIAGVLMWVPGSAAFLLPLFGIGVRLLYGEQSVLRTPYSVLSTPNARPRPAGRISLPLITPRAAARRTGFDLLRVPLLGRFLKWRHARLCLQLPLLLLAVAVIYDGLRGPQVGAMNLAGVLPWIHWRGLVILGLLVAGNVFCMGCPFLLPRTLARRWLPEGRSWPRWLRSKWLAVVLLVLFLWAYEAFALWDSPWWTAWLALGYFAAAFAIDGFFRGAAFCKYVCPIGQFNFVQSLSSPLEVKVRDRAVCDVCRTKDCIRGRDGIPGCELHLFLPRKASNMDCTSCLDCVHACPHDNVGLLARPPGAELHRDPQRSGIGRFSRRPDLAALILVLVFGAFANAAGMVGPVVDGQQYFAGLVGVRSPLLATTAFYLFSLVVLPLLAVGGAAAVGRWWGRLEASTLEVATRYAYTLVPLGFGMWLAHYCFHFLSSYDAAGPVAQRFASDLGFASLGQPDWSCACCRPVTGWLLRLEILFLDGGLLLSLYIGYRLAPTLKALAPWALLMVVLFAAGIWILFQPMQMRGTLGSGNALLQSGSQSGVRFARFATSWGHVANLTDAVRAKQDVTCDAVRGRFARFATWQGCLPPTERGGNKV
jgi:cytochrome c oxidase assembly factor CtaG